MRRALLRGLGIAFIVWGVIFLVSTSFSLTGFTIVEYIGSTARSVFGFILVALGILFCTLANHEKTLEKRLAQEERHDWKIYHLNPESVFQDIEQGYLSSLPKPIRTPMQERIEHAVAGDRLIDNNPPNNKRTYAEQFYEGHAAQGGRVIDVPSHIPNKGEDRGKLVHFGQPANAWYLWVVDSNGNFIVANRQTMLHDMPHMHAEKIDEAHRLKRLPHSTIARGMKVYGAGEVLVRGGKIEKFNGHTGHYIDLKDIPGFNKQAGEIFRYYAKKSGWKEADSGARYEP